MAEKEKKRGHKLFYFLPQDLTYTENQFVAQARTLKVRRSVGNHFTLGPSEKLSLVNDVDIVWLRQDPPFDMSYITTTYLLDFLVGKTMVFNNPFWVRNYPEKTLVLNYPDLTPPTMVGRNMEMFKTFREMHGDIIVKPLYGNGGAGIFKIGTDDPNLSSLLELFHNISREPIIMQKFLPNVKLGDKRIILVNGLPVGAINRVPPLGEIRSNMHVGGKPMPVELTSRDLEICDRVGPLMKEKGQVLVGLDIIGDMLTEINLTSPTGIQELERFNNINGARKIWECLEDKHKNDL